MNSGMMMIGKDTRLDLASGRVLRDDSVVPLTRQEYALLAALAENRGCTLSRGRLLQLAWGCGGDLCTRTVDVHIQHLRKKLGLGREIRTVYRVGYQLS